MFPYNGGGGGGGVMGGGTYYREQRRGPLLTYHARRLQWLAATQIIVSLIIFIIGLGLLAVIQDEYRLAKRSPLVLWSNGLPFNTLMPSITGLMGAITGFIGWFAVRTPTETRSASLKNAYLVLGILQMLFFDFPMIFYGYSFIRLTVTAGVGNGLYTRVEGDSLPGAERAMAGLAGACATLSIVNFILFLLSSAITCMCCDPFIDQEYEGDEMIPQGRQAYSMPPIAGGFGNYYDKARGPPRGAPPRGWDRREYGQNGRY